MHSPYRGCRYVQIKKSEGRYTKGRKWTSFGRSGAAEVNTFLHHSPSLSFSFFASSFYGSTSRIQCAVHGQRVALCLQVTKMKLKIKGEEEGTRMREKQRFGSLFKKLITFSSSLFSSFPLTSSSPTSVRAVLK